MGTTFLTKRQFAAVTAFAAEAALGRDRKAEMARLMWMPEEEVREQAELLGLVAFL